MKQHAPSSPTNTPDFSAFRLEVLNDYRLANESRQASLLGRKEVLTGKAKFGIFGDGKEVAQKTEITKHTVAATSRRGSNCCALKNFTQVYRKTLVKSLFYCKCREDRRIVRAACQNNIRTTLKSLKSKWLLTHLGNYSYRLFNICF